MTRWTWPEDSVRPYESLWILTQRFLWLNVLSVYSLYQMIGVRPRQWFRFDVITPNSTDASGKTSPGWNRLIRLINLTKPQARHATVNDSLSINKRNLRYCPECLRSGYHSAVFQITAFQPCPVHLCKLITHCVHCEADLPLNLYQYYLPLTCPKCRNFLAEPNALVNPQQIPGLSRIRDMWRVANETPRVEWTEKPQDGRALAKLALMTTQRMFRKGRDGALQFRMKPRIVPWTKCSGIDNDQSSLPRPEQRCVALYKAYRRHLQREISGARNFSEDMIKRLDDLLAERVWPPRRSEASAEAYAFGLFRYAVEYRGFEGLRTLHARRATWVDPASERKCLPDCGIIPTLKWPQNFHCSSGERQWIEDHAFMESLRGIFVACLEQGREMKQSGRFELGRFRLQAQGSTAASVAFLTRSGQFEFWSHREQASESQ